MSEEHYIVERLACTRCGAEVPESYYRGTCYVGDGEPCEMDEHDEAEPCTEVHGKPAPSPSWLTVPNAVAVFSLLLCLGLVLYTAGTIVGSAWGPLVAPSPGSCAEKARECTRRDGQIWVNKDGSSECTIRKTEKMP